MRKEKNNRKVEISLRRRVRVEGEHERDSSIVISSTMWSQRCEKCLQGCAGVVVNTFINGTLNANEPAEVTSWEVQSYEENLIGNFIKFWHCQAGSFVTSPDWMSGAVVHFFPPNCFIGQHLTISPFDWTHFDGKHLLWFWYFSKYQGIVTIISKWRKKKVDNPVEPASESLHFNWTTRQAKHSQNKW